MSDILRPNGQPVNRLKLVLPDGTEKDVEQPAEQPRPHTLQKVVDKDGVEQFRWVRADKLAKSPVFTTMQEALFYAKAVPLFTKEQWLQIDIPPHWLPKEEN